MITKEEMVNFMSAIKQNPKVLRTTEFPYTIDGKKVGTFKSIESIYNPRTCQDDHYITVAIGNFGQITISEFDEITTEQVKNYIAYKRYCYLTDIEDLKDKLNEMDEMLKSFCIPNGHN